jgi:selenocysteine lyase/cysteine desulfurase
MHPLEAWRDQFPILAERTYLISASLGPLSLRAKAAAEEHLDLWSRLGPEELWGDHALPKLQECRELFARLIGADSDEVAVIPSVSSGLSSIASCLNFDARSKIVMSDMDFPTNSYVWRAQQARGAKVEMLRSPDGIRLDPLAVADAIDEQTVVVNVNRVLFESSWIVDLDPIVAAAHERGAYVIVDDFHGAGIVPVDVHELGVDLYLAGALKWLMGGQGIAFLYCRRDLIHRLEPAVVGWFGTKDPFEFDRSQLLLRDDARRFETGTFALPQAWTAAAGLQMILEVGVENIRARNQELTTGIIQRSNALGLELLSPEENDQRGGLVRVRVLGGVEGAKKTLRSLFDRNVVLDQRGDALRISPHFFNNEADLDTAFEELERSLARS